MREGPRLRARIRARRVLLLAIVALVFGAAAVTALEVDQSMARYGSALPEATRTVTAWLAAALGLAAVGFWIVDPRRSHAANIVGALIGVVTVAGTPVALAIARPDDTPMTVVALDTRTGQRRWQRDIDLLYAATPVKLVGRDEIVLNGPAPRGGCKTRPARFTLDRRDGHTRERVDVEPPESSDSVPRAPRTGGNVRLDITRDQQSQSPTLRAREATGRVLWSTPLDGGRLTPVLYADNRVVAVYAPGTGPDASPSPADPRAGNEDVVDVLDTRTGRRRWTIHTYLFEQPVFSRASVLALEGPALVVHDTATGAVLRRHALRAASQEFFDAQLQAAGGPGAVALVEGTARRLTLLDRAGTVRWKTTLPRAMPHPGLTVFDDRVYVAGGGSLGYTCGGE